jgi:hypothetical protein
VPILLLRHTSRHTRDCAIRQTISDDRKLRSRLTDIWVSWPDDYKHDPGNRKRLINRNGERGRNRTLAYVGTSLLRAIEVSALEERVRQMELQRSGEEDKGNVEP